MSDSPRTEIVDAMPFAEYQAAPGVHKSMLDEFARCPLAGYEYMRDGGGPPTEAMIMGSLVDTLLCEPELVKERFHMRPILKPDGSGEDWHGGAKCCKEWLKAHADRPVVTEKDITKASYTVAAIRMEPKAVRLIQGCKVQQSLFWWDSYLGMQLKGRPDFVGPDYLIDLKTTRDASEQAISKAIASYRYYVQAALYLDGMKANGRECKAFYFLFVEPGDRPKPNVRKLKQEAIELGRVVYSDQLNQVKACMRANHWPGFSGDGDEVLTIDVPAYTYSSSGKEGTLKIGDTEIPI